MEEKGLRRWAWKQVKEVRGRLTVAVFCSMLPTLLFQRIFPERKGAILLLYWAVLLLAHFLELGVRQMALLMAKGEPAVMGDMTAAFQQGLWGKALTLVLLQGVLLQVPDPFSLLSNLFYFVVFFPLPFLLFLSPEESLGSLWKKGLTVGWKNGWRIFVYRFWLYLPAVGGMALMLWGLVLLRQSTLVGATMILAGAAIDLFFIPYIYLAEARFAVVLLKKR